MKKAFTLVELLVVIGIIGILAAILIGVAGGSRESAYTVKCQMHMHNLASAVHSTAMSNEYSYMPYAGSFTQYDEGGVADNSTHQAKGWIAWSTTGSKGKYLSPFSSDQDARERSLENGSIFGAMNGSYESYVCPCHSRLASKKKLVEPLWSYAMSAFFHWNYKDKPISHNRRGRRFTTFNRQDRYLLFAELPFATVKSPSGELFQTGDMDEGASQENDPVLQYEGSEGEKGTEVIGFNHKDGKVPVANVCFVDGHVEKFRAPKNFTQGDAQQLTKWLCYPRDKNGDFDVSFDGSQYKQVR